MTGIEISLWKTLMWFLGEILAHVAEGHLGQLPRDKAQEAIDLLDGKTTLKEIEEEITR